MHDILNHEYICETESIFSVQFSLSFVSLLFSGYFPVLCLFLIYFSSKLLGLLHCYVQQPHVSIHKCTFTRFFPVPQWKLQRDSFSVYHAEFPAYSAFL